MQKTHKKETGWHHQGADSLLARRCPVFQSIPGPRWWYASSTTWSSKQIYTPGPNWPNSESITNSNQARTRSLDALQYSQVIWFVVSITSQRQLMHIWIISHHPDLLPQDSDRSADSNTERPVFDIIIHMFLQDHRVVPHRRSAVDLCLPSTDVADSHSKHVVSASSLFTKLQESFSAIQGENVLTILEPTQLTVMYNLRSRYLVIPASPRS